MAVPRLKLADASGAAMDRQLEQTFWTKWSLGARVAMTAGGGAILLLTATALFFGDGVRSLRVPAAQVTLSTVTQAVFRDFVPLRAKVVPCDTVYLDATEGGRVEHVLVEPGEVVTAGQRLIEFGNTNLQLQVIQQESQLNQAISQLQQNEIALEQNAISNARTLADMDYNIVRLTRSAERRDALAAKGAASVEQREAVADELDYYKTLRPTQLESNRRQAQLRERLLPSIHDQLEKLQQNLEIVRSKLDNLIVRAPVTGRVTEIDLKVGENRNPGQRLAVITPDTGYMLMADVDEYYLTRVRTGQRASMETNGRAFSALISRVYPQVKEGRFAVDLSFDGEAPQELVVGQAMQGRLVLGDDRTALVLASGAFLERTGGDWVFVVNHDGTSADRRRIKIGRRNNEQLEIAQGLAAGERVITSDYTGYERVDRISLSQ